MAYNLQITDNSKQININVKYENMSKYKRPSIKGFVGLEEVKEQSYIKSTGQVLGAGSTGRAYFDKDDKEYSKKEVTFKYENEVVDEVTQTKVFEVEEYQALENYTDMYIIDKYYEVYPSDNGLKKDFDRERAIITNLSGMKQLWEHLHANKLVARGEFNVSSKGFVASDGYIRAVKFGNKWALEIGVFKEEKVFQHLQEKIPTATASKPKKKLKMV